MPKALAPELILEKNKVSSEAVWYQLLIIEIDSNTLRFTNNNEQVIFNSDPYIAFPFEVKPMSVNSEGKVPSITLSVNNSTRALDQYIKLYQGLVGADVTLLLVNSANLTSDYTELTLQFSILNCNVNATSVDFNLGAPSPLRKRFPANKYVSNYCNWAFKGVECGYAGADQTCTNTLEDCKSKGNTLRYGGFPGLSPNGIRLY